MTGIPLAAQFFSLASLQVFAVYAATAIILGWFAVGLVYVQKRFARLSRALATLRTKVEEANSDEDLDAAVPRVDDLPTVWRHVSAARFEGTKGKSVIGKQLADLFEADELVSETLWFRFCSATPNYLVGLGLGFTFLGLVLALSSIDANNLADPKNLTGLFGAMKFKFIASMAGIFSSIFFSLALRIKQAQLARDVAALLEALANRYETVDRVVDQLIRIKNLSTDQYGDLRQGLIALNASAKKTAEYTAKTANATDAASTQLKQFNTDISVAIANALDEKIAPKLTGAMKDVLAALDKAHGSRGETDRAMVTSVVAEFRQAVHSGPGLS